MHNPLGTPAWLFVCLLFCIFRSCNGETILIPSIHHARGPRTRRGSNAPRSHSSFLAAVSSAVAVSLVGRRASPGAPGRRWARVFTALDLLHMLTATQCARHQTCDASPERRLHMKRPPSMIHVPYFWKNVFSRCGPERRRPAYRTTEPVCRVPHSGTRARGRVRARKRTSALF